MTSTIPNATSTQQDIFDHVVAHARAQGCKAQDWGAEGSCMYRAPNNTRCFAGVCIPDADYLPQMEQKSVLTLAGLWLDGDQSEGTATLKPTNTPAMFFGDWPHANIRLLMRLQGVHDSYVLDQWEVEFESVAEHFGLTYTPR